MLCCTSCEASDVNAEHPMISTTEMNVFTKSHMHLSGLGLSTWRCLHDAGTAKAVPTQAEKFVCAGHGFFLTFNAQHVALRIAICLGRISAVQKLCTC